MAINRNKTYRRVLILPDIHAPWVGWDALKQAKRWHDTHDPDLVIQLGDLTDQKIWSRWQSDVDDYSPSQEFEEAEKALKKIHKWFPNMLILRGNHDERIKLKAIEAGIPGMMFNDVNDVFDFEGWEWIDREDNLIIKTPRGPVLFQHGDEMGGNVAAKSRILGMSIVQGHTHKVSITYTQTPANHFFGAEFGCLMDVNSKAARYAQANPVGTSLGFGVLKNGVPYFVSYEKGVGV
jgi:predicted phosphodiesterase